MTNNDNLPIIDIVVVRSKWHRGTEFHSKLLSSHTGKMCCLGFAALACGLKKDQIEGLGLPNAVSDVPTQSPFNRLCEWNPIGPGRISEPFIYVNDSSSIDDGTRESIIIAEGKKIGFNFSFVD